MASMRKIRRISAVTPFGAWGQAAIPSAAIKAKAELGRVCKRDGYFVVMDHVVPYKAGESGEVVAERIRKYLPDSVSVEVEPYRVAKYIAVPGCPSLFGPRVPGIV